MSNEIKPCMNDGCIENSDNLSAYNCSKFCTMEVDLCSKYTDTPPPKPFTPKNPDDYIPGECLGYNINSDICGICLAIRPNRDMDKSELHRHQCRTLPCYDPAPKPKTQRVLVIKIIIDDNDRCTGVSAEHSVRKMISNHWPENSGVSVDIIEEVVDE